MSCLLPATGKLYRKLSDNEKTFVEFYNKDGTFQVGMALHVHSDRYITNR